MDIDKIKEKLGKTKKLNSNNKSGYRGVHFHNKSKRFRAKIKINNIDVYIGQYKTAIEASEAYEKVKKELSL